MTASLEPARAPRTARGVPRAHATGAAAGTNAGDSAAAHAVDAIGTAFDARIELAAEMEREGEALEALAMAEIKNDDAIMKKWIALVG